MINLEVSKIKEYLSSLFKKDLFKEKKNLTKIPLKTTSNLASFIDHTLLSPTATEEDIELLCSNAKKYSFKSVCVNPYYLPLAVSLLKRSSVLPITVISFPLGLDPKEIKIKQASWAKKKGAKEVDLVMNISALKSKNYKYVLQELKSVSQILGKIPLKVIIETCLLSKEEKIIAALLTLASGANFVKTSTGFSKGGATVEDISLLKSIVRDELFIKASGGIKTFEDAKKMLEAGADRLGTSSSVVILKEAEIKL